MTRTVLAPLVAVGLLWALLLPRLARAEAPVDEEVLVDGEIVSVDLARKELVVEKTSGKKLTAKLTAETEVRVDGVKSSLDALKKGQEVRCGVFKQSREVFRVFVYEVTDRPPG